jgi:hypothetical protein
MHGGRLLAKDVIDTVPGQRPAPGVLEKRLFWVGGCPLHLGFNCGNSFWPQRANALFSSLADKMDGRAGQQVLTMNSGCFAYSGSRVVEEEDQSVITAPSCCLAVWTS